jgi:hypothetical protein
MKAYEKLGAFYLGKVYDVAARQLKADTVLYDSKDLNTHAVIIGMTGSGKTGLAVSLLEEALIDKIPIIAIDPKGDLPNLMLNFPQLQAADFRPWINEQDALNAGLTPGQFAAKQAALWRKGLADWDQDAERIAKLKACADFAVYTPGSNAGLPVSVLRNFAPPAAEIMAEKDLLRERIQSTVTALLALLDVEADPITSREHILLSNIIETTWAAGAGLDLAGMIGAIQSPPFERIGIMDLEAFYPAKERFQLAMRLNNLLAAPGFEAWLEGEPIHIPRMLYTADGKPRASIFTISHLSDAERMFFVSVLLNEIVAWMRTQPGTGSLRAILYMDEIFGYFPPVKNPPSKKPLLTMLKQARAFGLGVALSTQNPVDLDYKGLSNTGTWFIGRLQTDRDKQRVIEGLEGAAAGTGFDRSAMEEILAGLGKRVFLLNNVHENAPVTFQTRWVLSYLRGPMTRSQIKTLMTASKAQRIPHSAPAAIGAPTAATETAAPGSDAATAIDAAKPHAVSNLPVLPPEIKAYFLPASGAGQGLEYLPALAGWLDVHYSSVKYNVEASEKPALAAILEQGPVIIDWDRAQELNLDPVELKSSPLAGASFAPLPAVAKKTKSYTKWNKDLLRWVRQNRPLPIYRSKRFKLSSDPGESKADFLARLAQAARENRDLAVEKLRRKYSTKFNTLNNRLMRAEQAVMREKEQSRSSKIQTAISFGTAVLGAFMGRKAVSARSASRFGTAMRSASRIRKESMDVARARETLEATQAQLEELEERFQVDVAHLEESFDAGSEELKEILVKAKSTDMTMEFFGLVWMPHRRDARGQLAPDWI